MAVLEIFLGKIRENILQLDDFFQTRGLKWTLVLKVLAGFTDFYKPLMERLDCQALVGVADSRILHLVNIKKNLSRYKTWQIRPPAIQNADMIVEYVDVSCNSSPETLEALNFAAGKRGKRHGVVIMVEMGETREGVLPDELPGLLERCKEWHSLEILGLGTNLGCLYGVEPTQKLMQSLVDLKNDAEKILNRSIPLVSGGASINLPLLLQGGPEVQVNHYRIGEAVFFGTTPYDGKRFLNLNDQNFIFTANVLEVYDKELEPSLPLVAGAIGETLDLPQPTPAGIQAILDFGLLDADPKNLVPLVPRFTVLGASSDMTTLYDPLGLLKVGDVVSFCPDYMGVARLMVSATIRKVVQ